MIEAPLLVVAAIGAAFMPGTRDSYELAIQTFRAETKRRAILSVLPNLTVLPPFGLGAMRNFAILAALTEQKAQHVLLVDNDVLFDDPHILAKLMLHRLDYVTPWFDQAPIGETHRIAHPMLDKGQGLCELKWSTPYCVLWSASALNHLGPHIYTETAIYNEDEFNCLAFRFGGVKIMQDTDARVTLLRPPSLLADSLGKLRILKPGEHPV